MSGVTSTDHSYALLAHGRVPQMFGPGELIFAQGDQRESLSVVREGSVELRDADRVMESGRRRGCLARWR